MAGSIWDHKKIARVSFITLDGFSLEMGFHSVTGTEFWRRGEEGVTEWSETQHTAIRVWDNDLPPPT